MSPHKWKVTFLVIIIVKALNPNTNGFFDSRKYKGHNFVIINGKVSASGNIQYLLDPTGERMDVPENCYSEMFNGCTSLTSAPELPATSLAFYCYYSMFYNCTNITSVTMKASMNGVYDTSTHGDIGKTVEYVL